MDKIAKAYSKELLIVNRARTAVKIQYSKHNEIAESILNCCALIGLEAKPTPRETKVLMEYMQESLKRFTLSEMELAFKTMVQNKIEKIEPYGKFSPSFLQDVMDSYRLYRDKLTGDDIRNEMVPSEPIADINYKDCYDFIETYCEREKKMPFGANWSQAYDYMIREKMISPTKKEKADISYITAKTNSVKDESSFTKACKKEYILHYFEMKYGLTRNTYLT